MTTPTPAPRAAETVAADRDDVWALTQLEAAATPAPWRLEYDNQDVRLVSDADPEIACWTFAVRPWVATDWDDCDLADQRLIVAMRNRLSKLLAALTAAEATIAGLRGAVERVKRERDTALALVIEWREAHAWADNHTLEAECRALGADMALIDWIDEQPAYNDYLRAEAYALGPASPEQVARGMEVFRRVLAKYPAASGPSGAET